ncbi:MAG: hypothetical protein M5U34_20580 [Chloroflexi bacterium]|nr:hypothetical protein [Chloroflexota bacterium]
MIEAGRGVVEAFAEKVDGVAWAGMNDMLDIPNTAHILGGCAALPLMRQKASSTSTTRRLTIPASISPMAR